MMIPLLWSSLTATEAKPSVLSLIVVAAFAFIAGVLANWWLSRETPHCEGCAKSEREAKRLRGLLRDQAAKRIEADADNAVLREALERQSLADMRAVQAPDMVEGVMSACELIARERRHRAERALRSRDHTTRHSVDAVIDSEAATEILQFTIGGYETDRDET